MSGGLRRLSGETPIGRWEAVFAAPHVSLRTSVLGEYQGWAETAPLPVLRRHMPVVMFPIILNLGPQWEVVSPGNDDPGPVMLDSFIAGLHDQLAMTRSGGNSACIQVNLTALGAYRLLGLPMHEIVNRTIAVGELLGAAGRELTDRLREARNWQRRFDLLDHFLRLHIGEGDPVGQDVSWALGKLGRSHGRIAIGDLAVELGVSRKRLITRFNDQIGLPPKTVGRLYRFNRMLDLLMRTKPESLAELADACGYYDQAHFNREFREFAGCAPLAYLAELNPASPEMADY